MTPLALLRPKSRYDRLFILIALHRHYRRPFSSSVNAIYETLISYKLSGAKTVCNKKLDSFAKGVHWITLKRLFTPPVPSINTSLVTKRKPVCSLKYGPRLSGIVKHFIIPVVCLTFVSSLKGRRSSAENSR